MLEGAAVWYIIWVMFALILGVVTRKGMKHFLTGSKPFMIMMHGGAALWIGFVFVMLNLFTPQSMTAFVQNTTAPIKNTVGGVVETIHVKPLQHVKAGDALYTLDAEPYELALDAAEIDMVSAKDNVEVVLAQRESIRSEMNAVRADLHFQEEKLGMMVKTNKRLRNTYSKLDIDGQKTLVAVAKSKLEAAEAKLIATDVQWEMTLKAVDKAQVAIEKAKWNLKHTTVYAPADGTIPNTFLQEGMTLGAARPAPYKLILDEQHVLMPINYQGLMKIEKGNLVEFATPAYPLEVFSGEVVGVMHAGESDVMLMGTEQKTRQMMGMNYMNKQNMVKVKLTNAPTMLSGTSGMGWVSTGKQAEVHPALGFVNVIRGIIIRMKAQIYVVYSL